MPGFGGSQTSLIVAVPGDFTSPSILALGMEVALLDRTGICTLWKLCGLQLTRLGVSQPS